MITTYTKKDFDALDFDTKCVIFESLLTDDYFNGQMDINFYFVEEENKDKLPPKTLEMEQREEKEFNELLDRLTIKLFEDKSTIDLDLDEFFED
jgi:hypothetical protein